jgi:hypothetical protein
LQEFTRSEGIRVALFAIVPIEKKEIILLLITVSHAIYRDKKEALADSRDNDLKKA